MNGTNNPDTEKSHILWPLTDMGHWGNFSTHKKTSKKIKAIFFSSTVRTIFAKWTRGAN